jgi:hypothetical protein
MRVFGSGHISSDVFYESASTMKHLRVSRRYFTRVNNRQNNSLDIPQYLWEYCNSSCPPEGYPLPRNTLTAAPTIKPKMVPPLQIGAPTS